LNQYQEKPRKNVGINFSFSDAMSYRAFHGFGKAKFSDGGSVLGSSQFSILPQLPPKIPQKKTK